MDAPVRMLATGTDAEVCIGFRNQGAVIDQPTLERIFDPLQRGQDRPDETGGDRSLGLGLYIASEIAKAHDGTIDARSDQMETVFAVHLPRRTRG